MLGLSARVDNPWNAIDSDDCGVLASDGPSVSWSPLPLAATASFPSASLDVEVWGVSGLPTL